MTASKRSAMDTLRLDTLDVVHAGAATFPTGSGIRTVAMRRMLADVEPLG